MSDAVYKTIELTGCSSESMEAAVRNAVARAAMSLREIKWFEVLETRGAVREGGVAEWQVTVKIAFRIEEELRTAQI